MKRNFGYITVFVTAANGSLPLERAIVTVKNEEGKIMSVAFTDKAGFSPKIKVAAAVEEENIFPRLEYFIDAHKDGYAPLLDLSVPVYPEVTSIQPADLHSL